MQSFIHNLCEIGTSNFVKRGIILILLVFVALGQALLSQGLEINNRHD